MNCQYIFVYYIFILKGLKLSHRDKANKYIHCHGNTAKILKLIIRGLHVKGSWQEDGVNMTLYAN